MQTTLPQHDVVLLGLGHTNAHILRMWRMEPIPRTRLTCVSNFPVATYSGMLPGVLAGQYEPEAMQIDLVRLCAAAGARLILDDVVGLDREGRMLLFANRPPLRFDALSIGIGSVPSREGLEAADDTLLPIKPMQTFLPRLEERLRASAAELNGQPLKIVIVGGGVGGVEIAFCLPPRLARVLGQTPHQITIVEAGPQVGSGLSSLTSTELSKQLATRKIRVLTGCRVTHIANRHVWLSDGGFVPADIVLWATSAAPPPILAAFDLPKDQRGFLLTEPTLECANVSGIFAVGDSGTIRGPVASKAGVYAVREGPILWKNVRRTLRGQKLLAYQPQRRFLKLLNTGDGAAIGEYGGHFFRGHLMWWLKDRIDRKFMAMYQDYTPMSAKHADKNDDEDQRQARCLGCGGKVSGAILSRVLARLNVPPHPSVPLGLATPDDVALIQTSGQPLAVTTDFFAPPLDDPYLVGRMAALHAASDVIAKGARPLAALAIATIPPGTDQQQEQLLYDLLAGGLRELVAMGATLAGGHTIEGPQTLIGYMIIAAPTKSSIRTKAGLRVGDVLVLTKPLGIGVLLAAHMQARLKAEWYNPLVAALLASNQPAAELLDEFDVAAATDITGFGLAGHLLEMLRASSLSAELDREQVPLLPGAAELFASGLESTLAPANRSAASEIDLGRESASSPRLAALFDPQTCGGLLLGVAANQVESLLARLGETPTPGHVIGRVVAAEAQPHLRLGGSSEKIHCGACWAGITKFGIHANNTWQSTNCAAGFGLPLDRSRLVFSALCPAHIAPATAGGCARGPGCRQARGGGDVGAPRHCGRWSRGRIASLSGRGGGRTGGQ
jgi:selenide,water dikinase